MKKVYYLFWDCTYVAANETHHDTKVISMYSSYRRTEKEFNAFIQNLENVGVWENLEEEKIQPSNIDTLKTIHAKSGSSVLRFSIKCDNLNSVTFIKGANTIYQ